ncbi:MAG: hypothetical protein KJ070_07720 [Verrucomicrobia bacterium]|nr:hypothetical protein [Verrucomicrobiota bacterium]
MFNFDGEPTLVSTLTTNIIASSKLIRDHADELTVTVYRRIPLDHYYFITSMVGVSQPEPMFGPMRYDDERKKSNAPRIPGPPFGFANREQLKWADRPIIGSVTVAGRKLEAWRLHLSGRGKKHYGITKRFNRELMPSLRLLLDDAIRRDERLFPELWSAERRARDMIREGFRGITALSSLTTVVDSLTRPVKEFFDTLLQGNINEVTIYLRSNQGRLRLVGSHAKNLLPASVEAPELRINAPRQNALSWVCNASRPVLIQQNPSKEWSELLRDIGENSKLPLLVREKGFSGMCIVPLPDLTEPHSKAIELSDPKECLGVAVFLSTMPPGNPDVALPIRPAHHFLFCRLARVISGYLSPFLPLPGFPRWSEHVWRGGALINNQWASKREYIQWQPVVDQFVESLMPEKSKVHVTPIDPGFAAKVFKLEVHDPLGLKEIPRVIKIGEAHKIAQETENYFRYVHNKTVGTRARIDIARAMRDPANVSESGILAAVVYHFLDEGHSWAQWASLAPKDELEKGIRLLHDHLQTWSTTPLGEGPFSVGELLITRWFFNPKPVWSKLRDADQKNKKLGKADRQLQRKLKRVADSRRCQRPEKPWLIHGDLHAGNIFAFLDKPFDPEKYPSSAQNQRPQIEDVALIDWGNVTPDGHPLLDAAKLMVDLIYRVKWRERATFHLAWAKDQMMKWKLGRPPERLQQAQQDYWAEFCDLALIHQIAKSLVYETINPSQPVFGKGAVEQAYQDIDGLIQQFLKA